MTDVKQLEKIIQQKGLKKGFVAEKIGVSRSTFYAQLKGETEFKASHIRSLCDVLDIKDDETIRAIFFAPSGA